MSCREEEEEEDRLIEKTYRKSLASGERSVKQCKTLVAGSRIKQESVRQEGKRARRQEKKTIRVIYC